MAEKVESQEIESSDIGSASEVLGLEATAEISESVPEVEVEPVADEEEGKISWVPLANPKISGVLDHLAESLLKIKGTELYRNSGKSDYYGLRMGNMKGVAFIYLTKKSARVSCGEAIAGENGKTKSSFPKHLIFKATESGFTQDGERIQLKKIVAKVRGYKRDRNW